MKKIVGLITFTFAMSSAFATTTPLITKVNGAGHVHPDYGTTVRCDVFQDKVVVTNVLGFGTPSSFTVSEEHKIELSKDLTQVIEIAKAEKVETKDNFLCDGPSTTVSTQGDLLLFSTGGCGNPRQERTGVASMKLRNLVDLYCANTFGARK